MARGLSVGLVGLGRIGRIHLENLLRISSVEVTAVADPSIGDLELPLGLRGDSVLNTTHAMELIESDAVDTVVLCSPTDTHAEYIEASARLKKNIFCEKPVDLNVQRVREALGVCEAQGVRLHLGFNRRFDPSFSKLAAQIGEGLIGRPEILKITSRDPSPPPLDYVKRSGGLFMDMSIHDFDMAYFLLKSEIREVYVQGRSMVNPELSALGDVDTALTTLTFENGAIGVIDNSRRAVYGYDQRVEVFGSEGCLFAGNTSPDEVCHWSTRGLTSSLPHHFFLDRYERAYRLEMEDFVRSVLENKEPQVSGRDGLRAAMVAQAANESLKRGQAVQVEAL